MTDHEAATQEAKEFDAKFPSGTPVQFWPGARRGEGLPSRTRGSAWVLGGTAVVKVEDYAGGIALSHIAPIAADEPTAVTATSKIEPGLEARYHVARLHDPEGEHDDCPFFVLDPKHDPAAIEALRAYIRETKNPRLADDLDALVEKFAAPPAAGQPTTAEPTQGTNLSIEHGHLVEFVDHCTCGADLAVGFGHEPHCGLVPLTRLDNLPGWPGSAPDPGADIERAETAAIEVLEDDESEGLTTFDLGVKIARAVLTQAPAVGAEAEAQRGVRFATQVLLVDDKEAATEVINRYGGTLVTIREES